MDVAIVFFSSITSDNAPNKEGRKRLSRAIEMYRQGAIDRILLTGGGRKSRPLGECYRSCLINRKIPEYRIWLESSSCTTASNLKGSSDLLWEKDELGCDITWAYFISDTCHLLRIKHLANCHPWPCKLDTRSTGIAWSTLWSEPLKMVLNLLDPDEKTLGWFKRLRRKGKK